MTTSDKLPGVAATVDMICDRIDPAVAVAQVLKPHERQVFTAWQLQGHWHGAAVADWLDEADNAGAYGEIVDGWWQNPGSAHWLNRLLVETRLPERLMVRLLSTALRFTCAVSSADLTPEWRSHLDIAREAALWAAGYAAALGWMPAAPAQLGPERAHRFVEGPWDGRVTQQPRAAGTTHHCMPDLKRGTAFWAPADCWGRQERYVPDGVDGDGDTVLMRWRRPTDTEVQAAEAARRAREEDKLEEHRLDALDEERAERGRPAGGEDDPELDDQDDAS